VGLLLKAGTKPDIADHLGDSPIHVAASRGNQDAIQLLLSFRTDINIANSNKHTPCEKTLSLWVH
jgi:ankyrin repeat protein